MNWLDAVGTLRETPAPQGYELMQLQREDVRVLTESLRLWYPDIVVGAESRHLDADFYYDETQLADVTVDRSIFPIVAKRGAEITAMITFEKNDLAKTPGASETTRRRWDAEVPVGTQLVWRVRLADTREDLASAPWILIAQVPPDQPPADLEATLDEADVQGQLFLELEVALVADRSSPNEVITPVVRQFDIGRFCPEAGPI